MHRLPLYVESNDINDNSETQKLSQFTRILTQLTKVLHIILNNTIM